MIHFLFPGEGRGPARPLHSIEVWTPACAGEHGEVE